VSPLNVQGTRDVDAQSTGHTVAVCIVVGVFSLLLLRLWIFQIIHGEHYRNLSENNRFRLEDVIAPRGMILDRQGRILVDNRPAFNLAIIPEDVKDLEKTLDHLRDILDFDHSKSMEKLSAARSGAPFRPVVIKEEMNRDELAVVEIHRYYLPGVVVQVQPKRSYEVPSFAAHLLGYLGEIGQTQLKAINHLDYKPGDFLGKYGVEMKWEEFLKGHRGGRQVEVDSAGRRLRTLQEVSPVPGHNLVLTLDSRLQLIAENALKGQAGAIVAMNPDNGDILAMVSSPSFDQNQFVIGLTSEEWQAIVNDPLHPLTNKTIQGQYPPGSTFKPVVLAAALEKGLVNPDTSFDCWGRYRLGNQTYRCWRKGGHGPLDLYEALVRSCDIYFYQLGQKVGVDLMAEYARRFGLGSKTHIQLGNEALGLVPTSEWKQRRFGIPWQKGEDLVVAIGQGFVLVTPIQMALFYSSIANGGKLVKPRVVQRVEDADGNIVKTIESEIRKEQIIRPSTLSFLQKALAGVVQEPFGTGRAARQEGIKVAGKTGTAQVVRMGEDGDENIDEEPYEFRDHAWFLAFAPLEEPEILVAVLVEHGGHGGSAAAPIAREVMKEYFEYNSKRKVAHQIN
jgi:penicillin-binding protein 2